MKKKLYVVNKNTSEQVFICEFDRMIPADGIVNANQFFIDCDKFVCSLAPDQSFTVVEPEEKK